MYRDDFIIDAIDAGDLMIPVRLMNDMNET